MYRNIFPGFMLSITPLLLPHIFQFILLESNKESLDDAQKIWFDICDLCPLEPLLVAACPGMKIHFKVLLFFLSHSGKVVSGGTSTPARVKYSFCHHVIHSALLKSNQLQKSLIIRMCKS